jgi:hypothetical protein
VKNPEWNKEIRLREVLLFFAGQLCEHWVQDKAETRRVIIRDVEDLTVGSIIRFQFV